LANNQQQTTTNKNQKLNAPIKINSNQPITVNKPNNPHINGKTHFLSVYPNNGVKETRRKKTIKPINTKYFMFMGSSMMISLGCQYYTRGERREERGESLYASLLSSFFSLSSFLFPLFSFLFSLSSFLFIQP
jgi:hypothetical protein